MLAAATLAVCLFIGETFYGRLWYGFCLLPLFPAVVWVWRRWKERREQKRHLLQFLDGMNAFALAVRAGYAAENAVAQSRREMGFLYGEQAFICRELKEMERRLSANRPLEEAFDGLAAGCGFSEGEELSGILKIVKRQGGDLAETVLHSVRLSRERLRLSGEIETLLSGKRYEGRVMKAMPILILWLLRLSSPGFLDPLYDTLFGTLVMTLCLVLYGVAWLWEERLLQACT